MRITDSTQYSSGRINPKSSLHNFLNSCSVNIIFLFNCDEIN